MTFVQLLETMIVIGVIFIGFFAGFTCYIALGKLRWAIGFGVSTVIVLIGLLIGAIVLLSGHSM